MAVVDTSIPDPPPPAKIEETPVPASKATDEDTVSNYPTDELDGVATMVVRSTSGPAHLRGSGVLSPPPSPRGETKSRPGTINFVWISRKSC